MTLHIEIKEQNKEQLIQAIKLLKGVKSVQELESKPAMKEVKESKEDYKAWLKAREDLAKGDVISHEELKKSLGL